MGKNYKCLVCSKYFKEGSFKNSVVYFTVHEYLWCPLLDMFDCKSQCFNFTFHVNLSVKCHSVSQLSDKHSV